MSAADIARSAYEQAKQAAEAERETRAAEALSLAEAKVRWHRKNFERALPTLNEWFPGVKWRWNQAGDFGTDTVAWDASETSWPPSFFLLISGTEIEAGEYRPDSSQLGYTFFAGRRVNGPADIGRYLEDAGK